MDGQAYTGEGPIVLYPVSWLGLFLALLLLDAAILYLRATMNSYAMKVRGNRKDSTQLPQIYSVMSSLLKLAQDGLS